LRAENFYPKPNFFTREPIPSDQTVVPSPDNLLEGGSNPAESHSSRLKAPLEITAGGGDVSLPGAPRYGGNELIYPQT